MKERLDVLVYSRGFCESREKAKALIMAGLVFVKGEREDKAGTKFDENVEITVKGRDLKYVGRGGLKLEKALEVWGPDLTDKVCIDVGASTGGFTDCMLQNGAAKVYAIDSGTNQLHWKLRSDERVICMEKTNIKYVTPEDIGELCDFVSIDVSFISLKKVFEPVISLMKDKAEMVCLIKPQFEAGREKVGKKGIVREKETHIEVLHNIIEAVDSWGFSILGMTYSPVKGTEGNIEFLMYLRKNDETVSNDMEQLKEEAVSIVNEAGSQL